MIDKAIDVIIKILNGVGENIFSLDITKLTATIVGAAVPFLISALYKRWKNSVIHSLNECLVHKINPIIALIAHLFFWIFELCIVPAYIAYCLYNGSNLYWLYGVVAALMVICIKVVFYYYNSKDRKGLVGLLTHDLKTVSTIEKPVDENCIHFVKMKKDDGTVCGYEERTVIKDSETIKNIVEGKILEYYTNLKKEMGNKKCFIINGKHICDFMLEVYSVDNIMAHIERVVEKMSDDNSINFIGDKIGIEGYNISKGKLTLDIYMTDHFTFNVFKDIFKDKKVKNDFKTIIRRTNIVNKHDKILLVRSLKYLLSSFGIDIVIHGRTANKKRGMLVGLRSGRIEKSGESKLHVPVNETFTKTDVECNRYSLFACVKRGINEELGIPTEMIRDESISFHDFALVTDEGEIGLGCHVDLSKTMTLEQARLYPGQDKYMEMDNLVIVPYPPFFWNPNKYIEYFYMKSYNDIFCTPWESFTPLLYQRCIVRNMKLGNTKKWNFFLILLFNIFILYFLIPNLSDWIVFVAKTISTTLYSIVVAPVFISIFDGSMKRLFRDKTLYLKPLVPQWGGDVRVLQATNFSNEERQNTSNNDTNPIASDLYFCIVGKAEECQEYPLSKLKLQNPPFCKVRREVSKDNNESPISYYIFQPQDNVVNKSRLFFTKVPANSHNGNLIVDLNVTFDSNNNMTYHFTTPLEPQDLSFSESFTEEKIENFQNLFSLPPDTIKTHIRASLDKSFKSRYVPLDLFLYRGNYYWSVFDRNIDDLPVKTVDKYTIIYDDYIKDIKQNVTIRLSGPSEILSKKISQFISNNKNRSRISSLDIYMLQLAFTRLGNDNNGIILGIEKSCGIIHTISGIKLKVVRIYRNSSLKVFFDKNIFFDRVNNNMINVSSI